MHNASFGLALEERHNNSVCRILFYYWVPLISRGGLVLFSFIIAFKGIQETSSSVYLDIKGPNRAERAHGFLKKTNTHP